MLVQKKVLTTVTERNELKIASLLEFAVNEEIQGPIRFQAKRVCGVRDTTKELKS